LFPVDEQFNRFPKQLHSHFGYSQRGQNGVKLQSQINAVLSSMVRVVSATDGLVKLFDAMQVVESILDWSDIFLNQGLVKTGHIYGLVAL
jgi:hypothetical protein